MRRSLAVAAAATLLLGSACGQQSGGESTDDSGPIEIGVAISETGDYSVEAGGLRDGYDLWTKWVNDRGGIDVDGTKRKVKLIYEDDQSNPEAASQLTERLITQDEVDFLFGPYSSTLTMATSAIAERHGVINMSGGGASEEIFERGFKRVFGLATPTKDYTRATLETLQAKGATTLGIIHVDDPAMNSVAAGAEQQAEELGMEVVVSEQVPQVADYTSAMQRVAQEDPDVFIGAGAFQSAISFTRSAEQINFKPDHMVLVNGPADPEFVEQLDKSAENIIGPTQWHRTAPFSDEYFGTAEEFAKLFENTYGEEPSYVASVGAATGLALQLAIEAAGTADTEAVREALLELDTETFFGPANFTESGINEHKPMPGVQVQNGETVVIAPMPEDATWELEKYSSSAQ